MEATNYTALQPRRPRSACQYLNGRDNLKSHVDNAEFYKICTSILVLFEVGLNNSKFI
jgi:hypothetical protein